MKGKEAIFIESQKIPYWMYLSMLAKILATVIISLWWFGTWSTSHTISIIVVLFFMFIASTIDLRTMVTKKGIYFQYYPFHQKKHFLSWEAIKEAYVREYKPIREYGGWGLRFGKNGKVYNLRGNKGLQLKFKNGKNILLGTQKSLEIEQILKQIKLSKG